MDFQGCQMICVKAMVRVSARGWNRVPREGPPLRIRVCVRLDGSPSQRMDADLSVLTIANLLFG